MGNGTALRRRHPRPSSTLPPTAKASTTVKASVVDRADRPLALFPLSLLTTHFFPVCARRTGVRLDVVKHFPSIDHAILLGILGKTIADERILHLAARTIASGDRILEQEYAMVWFPGDDLFTICRPRGLPIGNLTSQFWSNCYLNPLDQFVKRELRCAAYLRYVDDMALFSGSKRELWEWKSAILERLQSLRLTIHEGAAQVQIRQYLGIAPVRVEPLGVALKNNLDR